MGERLHGRHFRKAHIYPLCVPDFPAHEHLIYYTARRSSPLSEAERSRTNAVIDAFSVEQGIERYIQTGSGLNGDLFGLRIG